MEKLELFQSSILLFSHLSASGYSQKKKISLFMAYYTQPHDTMIAYDNETNKAYAFLCLKRIQISFPSPSIAHIRIFVMNRTFVKMGISHHGLHQRASNKEFKAENLTPCLSTPFSIHL